MCKLPSLSSDISPPHPPPILKESFQAAGQVQCQNPDPVSLYSGIFWPLGFFSPLAPKGSLPILLILD